DIPHRISAGLADRNRVFFEFRPELRCFVQAHEVDLNILPRGGVEVAAAIFVRDIRNATDLLGGNASEWKLDTHHLHAGLALAINAAKQANAAEFVIVDLPFAKQLDLVAKIDNVRGYDGIVDVFKL